MSAVAPSHDKYRLSEAVSTRDAAHVPASSPPRSFSRLAPWLMMVLMIGLVLSMNFDRQRNQQRVRDLEERLGNLLAGYREQRSARRELYAARLEIARLKATLGALRPAESE